MRVELARTALMLTPTRKILAVALAYVDDRRREGWIVIANDADVLPFNAPRIVGAPDEGGD